MRTGPEPTLTKSRTICERWARRACPEASTGICPSAVQSTRCRGAAANWHRSPTAGIDGCPPISNALPRRPAPHDAAHDRDAPPPRTFGSQHATKSSFCPLVARTAAKLYLREPARYPSTISIGWDLTYGCTAQVDVLPRPTTRCGNFVYVEPATEVSAVCSLSEPPVWFRTTPRRQSRAPCLQPLANARPAENRSTRLNATAPASSSEPGLNRLDSFVPGWRKSRIMAPHSGASDPSLRRTSSRSYVRPIRLAR